MTLRIGGFSNSNKVWYSQFFAECVNHVSILYWTVLVKSDRYCCQTNQEYFLYDRWNFRFNVFNWRFESEDLVIRIKSGILNFCGMHKSRFQCCTGSFSSNQLVIVVKRIRNISFKILQTFVLIPLFDASNGRLW